MQSSGATSNLALTAGSVASRRPKRR